MGLEVYENNKIYLSIIKGNLTRKVNEGAPGAVRRDYETSDGKKAHKFELVYKAVNGFVKDMHFKDSDFGEQFVLVLEDGEEIYQIQTPVDGRYFQDFAKKVSNIYLDMDFSIAPYDFEDENGNKRSGLTIKQEGQKVENWFWDGKKVVNGFPKPEGNTKEYSSDDWKIHFIKVKKFLKAHVEKVWAEQPQPGSVQAEPKAAEAQPQSAEVQPQDDF